MNLNRISAIVLREYYLMKGSPSRLLPIFLWVGIDIVLWGFITKYLDGVVSGTVNLVSTLLGAVLLWDFLTRAMQGVTMTFFEDVWARNFLNVFASPISILEYLLGLVLTSSATCVIALITMLVVSTLIFGFSLFSYGVMLVPFLLILFISGIALGIVGTSIVLRWGPAAEWFIWPIPALISPFVGVFYPLSVLPVWMRAISYLFPASYVFEGMRSVVHTGTLSVPMLVIGGALSIVYLILACLLFAYVHRLAVRSGLIARYSAETVS